MDRYCCPCCGVDGVKPEAKEALERLEAKWGPLKPTSAFRCEAHNKAVRGALKSKHLDGIAFDIPMNSSRRQEFIKVARECGFTSFGLGVSFVHIDIRNERVIWVY
jgi:uncharacterized protein YcbK (DUF882 family)